MVLTRIVLLSAVSLWGCSRGAPPSAGPLDETIIPQVQGATFGVENASLPGTIVWSAKVSKGILTDHLDIFAQKNVEGIVFAIQGQIDLTDLGIRDGERLTIGGDRVFVPGKSNGVINLVRSSASSGAIIESAQLEVVKYDLVIDGSSVDGAVVLHPSTPSLHVDGPDRSLERALSISGMLTARGCEVFESDSATNFENYVSDSHPLCNDRFTAQ